MKGSTLRRRTIFCVESSSGLDKDKQYKGCLTYHLCSIDGPVNVFTGLTQM